MIGFAGLSHLGILSSAAAAAKGFEVVGFDPDTDVCRRLSAGDPCVVEPGLAELVVATKGRSRYSADPAALAACDVIYVSVDVPTNAANQSDTAPVERLLQLAADHAKPGATLVTLSQVPPGFSRRLQQSIESRDGKRLQLLYQVETLVFGIAVDRALHPERFIVGCADPSEPIPPALDAFLKAFDCPVLPMRYESAELCKISINMFLVSSVSTTNMLANVCEVVGAEWREIAPALRLDRRIGPSAYLTPGLGIGGGNLTRDLATISGLAAEYGADAQLVGTWNSHSGYRRDWVLRVLHDRVLGAVADPVIAVWGLAYKENTQSLKNSPGVHLLSGLTTAGIEVRSHDPGADLTNEERARFGVVPRAMDACDGADALAVMTPWAQFSEIDLEQTRRRMKGRVLIDPFGGLDPARASAAGFEYFRLGSGSLN
jgi:UDPglucose 6-dehydrogenase